MAYYLNDLGVVGIIFAVIALILTILSLIFITPRSKKPYLNGFFKWLHGVFNFDSLLIDKILKFLYIFSTFLAIFMGILLIIEGFRVISYTAELLLIGLLVLVLGPFVVRLIYEGMMMFIILVKHVAEINRKVKDENPPKSATASYEAPAPVERAPRPARPAPAPAPAPAPVCPGCGSKMRPGAKFCGVCGYRMETAPAPTSYTAPTQAPSKNGYYPNDSDL